MVKRINEAFNNSDFEELAKKKEYLRAKLGLNRLSWGDFILYSAGVKK